VKADGRSIPVAAGAIYEQMPAGLPAQVTSMRSKVIAFPQFAVGDTASYTVKVVNKQPLFRGQFLHGELFPRTVAYGDVKGRLTVPKSLKLRVENHDIAFKQEEAGPNIIYSWSYSAPRSQADAPSSLSKMDRIPRYFFSSFADHADLGKAYAALTAEKRIVTRKVATLAQEITAGTGDRKQQVQKLYEWVSAHIRYVAIELGTGAVTPHEVDSIIANGYGDCKDHDVLLQALLKAKGIESESVLINGDDSYAMTEIPTLATLNHVITFVPEFDLYLDSTATVAPFGILPPNQYGKPVIVAAPASAKLARMPLLQPGAGKIVTRTVAALDKDGNLSGTTVTTASGPFAVTARALGLAIQAAGTRATQALLAARGMQAGEGSITQDPPVALTPSHTFTGTFKSPGWSEYLAGDRSFVLPGGFRVMNLTGDGIMGPLYPDKTDSEEPQLCYSAEAMEDISLKAPPGLRFNRKPDDTRVETPNLTFTARWSLDGDTISVHREFRSRIDSQFCTGEVRRQTEAALRQIADSYDVLISFQEMGPAGDLFREALAHYDAGRYRESVAAYGKLIALKPERANNYYNRAIAYDQLGEYDAALKDYGKALEIATDKAEYYLARGRTYGRLRQPDKALADISKAVSLDPGNPEYLSTRGFIYYRLRRLDEAQKDLDAALALSPDFPLAHYNLGLLHAARG